MRRLVTYAPLGFFGLGVLLALSGAGWWWSILFFGLGLWLWSQDRKVGGFVLAFFLLAPSAQAATVAQIKAAVEGWRTTYGPKIVARQEAYRAAHGRYWQGIITPAVPPDDGASVAPDYTARPTDQLERWLDVFKDADALPATIPAQIRVDVYDGPLGQGWTVTLIATKAGMRYWRTWHVGPETWRAQDWQSCTLPCEAR